MLKPTANYKMGAQNKRFLATILDPHLRGEIKRSMIQADLYGALAPKREKKPRFGADAQTDSSAE